MNKYPLLLKPTIKDYLWGGTKLKTDFGFKTEKDIAAEAWVLSLHKDGMNIVLNGEYSGKPLNEVLETWGKSALGKNAERFSYFPILIKLIDAKQKLSVQVHPDDKYALSVEGEYGKTEMWYVVDCDEGAELIYGFKEDISKEEFESRIKDNTLTEVCNFVPVNKGDVFFIEAGTLHAIGEGILIAEVQQNSNTTYRVSDYGRLGADGKPRPLHIEKAVDDDAEISLEININGTSFSQTLFNESKNFGVSQQRAIEIAGKELSSTLSEMKSGGGKTAEAMIKILKDYSGETNRYFWYVGVAGADGKTAGILIDANSGEVVSLKV